MEGSTYTIAHANEGRNANQYLSGALERELARVQGLDAKARREVYRLRQATLDSERALALYTSVSRMAALGLCVVMLALAALALRLRGALPSWAALLVIASLVLAYVLVLLYVVLGHARRRKTSWHHFYWGLSDDMKSRVKAGDGACSG